MKETHQAVNWRISLIAPGEFRKSAAREYVERTHSVTRRLASMTVIGGWEAISLRWLSMEWDSRSMRAKTRQYL